MNKMFGFLGVFLIIVFSPVNLLGQEIILTLENTVIANKTYDGTSNAEITDIGQLVGVEEGDQVELGVEQAVAYFETPSAGNNKTVVVSNLILSGPDAGKYTISDQEAQANILRAELIITASDIEKLYDAEVFTSFTVEYSGFVEGENESVLSGDLYFLGDGVDAVGVGDYFVFPQGLESENYNIFYFAGMLYIFPAELHITADNKSKVYDGDVFSGFTASFSGFVGGENTSVLEGELSFAGPALNAVNAGTYSVFPQGLFASNYDVYYNMGILHISPVSLSVSASHKQKEYDGEPFTGFSVVYEGFITGEDESVLSGSLVFSGDAINNASAGTWTIIPSGLISGNYTLEFINGVLIIQPKPLTITANDISKPVNTEYVFVGTEFTVSGLVEGVGDEVESAVLSSPGAIVDAEPGDYTITVSGATGIGLNNYSISYFPGTLSVEERILLTLTGIEAADKVYDGTVTATIANYGLLEGVLQGDDVFLNTDAAVTVFEDKNAGINKTVFISHLALAGTDAHKYTIGDYVTQADITLRDLTLSGFFADNKMYDGTIVVSGTGFNDNRISGDNLSFSYQSVFESPDASDAALVLFTSISISGGADQLNYTLLTASGTGTAQILPVGLAVSADDKMKYYGETDPELTFAVIEGQLVGNDAFSGELQRQTGENPGTYAILQGTLTAGNNYSIAFTQGILVIEPNHLVVTIQPEEAALSGASWSVDGVNWYESGYTLPLNPGSYTLVFSDIDNNAWYVPQPISFEHGSETQITGIYAEKVFLTVLTPEGYGTVVPGPGEYDYPAGSIVEMVATAAEGWKFTNWILGEEVVTQNPVSIPLNESMTVLAVFEPDIQYYTLTLTAVGQGSFLVNGETYMSPLPLEDQTLVSIEAMPAQGYLFSHWEGDLEGSENPATVLMDGNKSISGVFEMQTYTVTFNINSSGGNPITDATVTLGGETNQPGDYVFENILPGVYSYTVSRTGYISITSNISVTQDRIVNVNLMPVSPPSYTVTFVVKDEYNNHVPGAVVTFAGITHSPGNYVFAGITSGTYNYNVTKDGHFPASGEVSVAGNKTVNVLLEFTTYVLEISQQGEGETDPEPGTHLIDKNTFITLSAYPAAQSKFLYWDINGSENENPEIEILMDSNTTAVAHFQPSVSYVLEVGVIGEGFTQPEPGQHYFGSGTEVQLQAVPAENFAFLKWEVDGEEFSQAEITITMHDNRMAIAWFDLIDGITIDGGQPPLKIFPIPAANHLYIELNELQGNVRAYIIDIQGRLVQELLSGTDSVENLYVADVSDLTPGLYILKVHAGYKVESLKFSIVR